MSPKSSQRSQARPAGPTRISPNWFFPEGDLLLRCNTTLYLVHSEALASVSLVFREALARPAPTTHLPSFQSTLMGRDRCRTHSKGVIKSVPAQELSLSQRFWIHQSRRLHAKGVPVKQLSTGKAAKMPKVLVVEDRESNVDHLLYFLYSRPYVVTTFPSVQACTDNVATFRSTPITKESLPHILTLGIRYQIASFINSALGLLHKNAKVHPLFVIKTLQPFIPPPSAQPTNSPNSGTVISSIYDTAISALLDNFPAYHESHDPRVREDYMASVPQWVQEKCSERWNKYVWNMSHLRSGEAFISRAEGIRFQYKHDETCTASSSHRVCEVRMRAVLYSQWKHWWNQETVMQNRLAPAPSRLSVFLTAVMEISGRLATGGHGAAPGLQCTKEVMKGAKRILEQVVGPSIWLWKNWTSEIPGLRLNEVGVEVEGGEETVEEEV